MRFQCLGFDWDYISSSQLGEVAQHVIGLISRPWEASGIACRRRHADES